ncbi:FAD-dependent oxidoreductase [Marinitenerispora sediminis]|uniref:Isorenieratene synthase n=1 Tax=Marinitenerispora sediminis TaxID=1931232 RepID=A0A368T0B3_9ACTN|nr:FAD-dependent oxidoreductase [Marinitenerispora sediminis]RCV49801.1 isorenieratene synthase [Marinitenerispora sediminis]RCV52654.1 isorenieratene synthase [Marinitenerispora sediminis]RCV55758.1 isorenieratene synthase [Marinitenerispora sediminis]
MTLPGRDPRAECVPPRRPVGPPADDPRAVVVGGGIAGLAAAVALGERGVRTTLLEREPQLGGRLRAWPTTLRDGSTVTMSRGFHAFFRQYYNLRALLRRIDPGLGMLAPLPEYPVVHRAGARDGFAGLPATPPWNAFAFALRSRSFPVRAAAGVNVPAALQLLDVDVPGVYHRLDHVDAARLLRTVRFPERARHLAFEVFSRSFFADPRRLSAAELAVMFHLYFLGSAEGLLFDVPTAPFSRALWDPLAGHLAARGVRVDTGCAVTAVSRGGPRRFRVRRTGGPPVLADAVVLATDSGSLGALADASPDLGGPAWRLGAGRLPNAPPFLVCRLWLDRPVAPGRPGFLGTAGHPTLDNVSVLERFEDEAADWARRTGGSVVELHGYALPEGCSAAVEHRRLVDQLHDVYPETARARVVDERHELRADCPLFPPGGFPDRLGVATPDPWLVLAGDHVRVDLPVALMERAATSGFLAANALLHRWGRPGHTLWTVPRQGRTAAARALARWARSGSGVTDGSGARQR